MASAINQTIPLKCDAVEISQSMNGVVTVTVKVCGKIVRVYDVVPKLEVRGEQATATTALINVTPRDEGDDIPF